MTDFPKSVRDYWHRTFACQQVVRDDFSCAVSTILNVQRPAMMLEMIDGSVRAAIRPEIVQRAGIENSDTVSLHDIKSRLIEAGVTLHEPDYLFYLAAEPQGTANERMAPRQLTEDDRTAFDVFYNTAS